MMLGFESFALIFVFINLMFASVWVANTEGDELRNRRGDVVALLLCATAALSYRCWSQVTDKPLAPAPSVYSPVFVPSQNTLLYQTCEGRLDLTTGTIMTTDCFSGDMRVSPELERAGGR